MTKTKTQVEVQVKTLEELNDIILKAKAQNVAINQKKVEEIATEKKLLEELKILANQKDMETSEIKGEFVRLLQAHFSIEYTGLIDINSSLIHLEKVCFNIGTLHMVEVSNLINRLSVNETFERIDEFQEVVTNQFIAYSEINAGIIKTAQNIRDGLVLQQWEKSSTMIQSEINELELEIDINKKNRFERQSTEGHKNGGSMMRAIQYNITLANKREANLIVITRMEQQIDTLKKELFDYLEITPVIKFLVKIENFKKTCENIQSGMSMDPDQYKMAKNGAIRVLTNLAEGGYYDENSEVAKFLELEYKDQINSNLCIELFLQFARSRPIAIANQWHDTLKCNIKDSKTM